jgi:hypothetical protein
MTHEETLNIILANTAPYGRSEKYPGQEYAIGGYLVTAELVNFPGCTACDGWEREFKFKIHSIRKDS